MSVKWKLFLILILGILASVGAGVYITQHPSSTPVFEANSELPPETLATPISQDILDYPERSNYQAIPLSSINSNLQGSDPATLAMNAFYDLTPNHGSRKVEVVYPQRNQALVTITQINRDGESVGAIKYRAQMTTFGRSLLVSSPPVWQIIWAGSQVQCVPGSSPLQEVQISKSYPERSLSRSVSDQRRVKIQNEASPFRECYSPNHN